MAKNREKITYIDDGRTVADMSGVPDHRPEKRHPATPHPRFKDAWNTYWAATKMMLLPTLFFTGGLALIFGICWLFFKFM